MITRSLTLVEPAPTRAAQRTSTVADFTDAALLAAFVAERRDDAFAQIIARHGPMVLSVCRRTVGARDDAQDAFQVTFLILAKKAGSIRRPEALGSWLFGVARRVARKARHASARRQEAHNRLVTMLTNKPPSADNSPDLVQVVEEEIERLPAQYRMAVVACYLEGKTNREAARALGWPEGTLVTRLNRAKDIIRKKAAARGLKISAAAVALILSEQLAPASTVPAALLASTAKAAAAHAAGNAGAAAMLSDEARSLLAESSRLLWIGKAKVAALVALTLVVTAGAAFVANRFAARGGGGDLAAVPAEFKSPIVLNQGGAPDVALLKSVRDLRAAAFAAARAGSGVAQDDGAYDDLGADRPAQDRRGTIRFAFAPDRSVTRVAFPDNPDTALAYALESGRILVYRKLPQSPPLARLIDSDGSALDHKPLEWSVAQIARISPWPSDAAFFDHLLTAGPKDVVWQIRRDGDDVVRLTIDNRRGGAFEQRIAGSKMLVEFDTAHHAMTRLFRFERPFTADDGSQKTEFQLHRITWRTAGPAADVPVERRVSLATQTPDGVVRPRSASVVRFEDFSLGSPPPDLLSPATLGIPEGTPVEDPANPAAAPRRWSAAEALR